jgi:hypothetical protein
MSDDSDKLQLAAENRVRRRFDRETAVLHTWQDNETRSALLSQSRLVADSRFRQMALEGRKMTELAEHDKLWNQARDRLTPKPAPAPVFDMMGGPPPRNLAKDYDELRRGYEAGRAGIAARHNEGIAACAAERAEKVLAFVAVNTARDHEHKENRIALDRRHEVTFEKQVKRELDRADRWISRPFNRRSRDDQSRDL